MAGLTIRPIEKSDLYKMDYTFKSEFGRTHADDLHDQSLSNISFMVAWLHDNPVGHALAGFSHRQKNNSKISQKQPACLGIKQFIFFQSPKAQFLAL